MRAGLALASTLPLFVACQGGHARPEIGVSASAVSGTADTAERYPGVVGMAIRKGQAVARCTGTLIAPNLLLTARHCVSPTASGLVQCGSSPFGPPYPGSEVRATTKVVETDDPLDYVSGSDVRVVPGGDDECGFDLAAVFLREPGISSAVATPFAPRLEFAVQSGELFSAVGYGSDGNGALGTRRVRDGLSVSCLGGSCPFSEVQPSEWMGESGGVCRGDSGAPAFDSNGLMIGVVSRGANECDYPIHSELFSRKDWLIGLALEAAALGGYPVPAWAGGSAEPDPGPEIQPEAGPEPTPGSTPRRGSEAEKSGCSLAMSRRASPNIEGWLLLLAALYGRRLSAQLPLLRRARKANAGSNPPVGDDRRASLQLL